jgi:hypothetical protein
VAVWLCLLALCTVIQTWHLDLLVILIKAYIFGGSSLRPPFYFSISYSGSPNNSERAMWTAGEMCKGPGATRALWCTCVFPITDRRGLHWGTLWLLACKGPLCKSNWNQEGQSLQRPGTIWCSQSFCVWGRIFSSHLPWALYLSVQCWAFYIYNLNWSLPLLL